MSETAVAPQPYEGHFDGLNEGSFIKATDFALGTVFTVTIEGVTRQQLEGEDGKKKGKGVVKFTGKAKEWVSNKTNQICIAKMFGPLVKDWIGKRVTFVVEMIQMYPENRPGFRVKGSPDIAAPIDAEIKLPRKRPVTRTLVPTPQPAGGAK
jgi:hypothetical protein